MTERDRELVLELRTESATNMAGAVQIRTPSVLIGTATAHTDKLLFDCRPILGFGPGEPLVEVPPPLTTDESTTARDG